MPALARALTALSVAAKALAGSATAHAQGTADLAKQLANPIATLVSVPFQFNWDRKVGAASEGDRYTLNLQPVVPMSIGENWNLITRTILPFISQDDVVQGAGSQFGLGDTVQSFFFSPKAPTSGGLIWGVGPALLLPTATDDLLGSGKWGAGPTGVVLSQQGHWTIGMLANHIWSFGGSDRRADVSSTFLQPFVTYNTSDGWTFTLTTDLTYDWESAQWSVPIGLFAAKVVKIGDQLVQFGGGPRYYVDSTTAGPKGWGARVIMVLLFPR